MIKYLKNNVIRQNNFPIILIFFFFIIHLLFIGLWPVNFEFTFSEGAKYFKDFDKGYLDFYKNNNANTFMFPLLIGLINKIIPIDNLVISKILSSSSYIFLGFAIINFHKYLNLKVKIEETLILIFLNPIVWYLGLRGTPDLIATSIALFSISNLIINKKENLKNLLYLFLFSLAVLLKPFVILSFIIFIYIKFEDQNFKININLIKKLILNILIISLPLILFYKFLYFEITNDYANDILAKYGGFLSNFFLYSAFIFISIGIFLFHKIKYIIYFILISLVILFISTKVEINFDINHDGEMNFGFLTGFFSNDFLYIYMIFLGILIFYLFIIFTILTYLKKRELFKKIFPFLLFLIISIAFLSFFRPVQRYLILVLPIIILICSEIKYKNLFLSISYLAVFVFLNLLITNNQISNSLISKKVFNYLDSNELLFDTYPGELNAHIRHLFVRNNTIPPVTYETEKRNYIISKDYNEFSIKSFEVSFIPIIKKKLYLNKCEVERITNREGIICKYR